MTSSSAAVPTTLLTGFLGAGKTTLLQRILLGNHEERIAVLVNDFGDLSIDADLIEHVTDTTIALKSGCICCSIRDDLIGAVRSILQRRERPGRILIEASGVSEPGSVLRTLSVMERSWPLDLDGVIALLDSESFPQPDTEHYWLARDQLACADLILLNKSDLVGDARRRALEQCVREWVPTARVLTTEHANVPLELVLGVGVDPNGRLPGRMRELPKGHGAHAQFGSFTYVSPHALALARLRELMTELPPTVFRAKGIVQLDAQPDHRTVLQVVGRRARVTLGKPWGDAPRASRIVFVGSSELNGPELQQQLESCRATGNVVSSSWADALEWIRRRFGRFTS